MKRVMIAVFAATLLSTRADILIDYNDYGSDGFHDAERRSGGFNNLTSTSTGPWVFIGTGTLQILTDLPSGVGSANNFVAGWDSSDAAPRVLAMDTSYTIAGGETYNMSYMWRDAYLWDDPGTDTMNLTLYYTDDNTIRGNATDIATLNSGFRTSYEAWETESVTGASGALGMVGKKLFVRIDQSGTDTAGFARVDNIYLEVILPEPPAAPSDLASTFNGSDIDLSWIDNSDNESGFKIYQSKDGGAYELIHTTVADVESYTVVAPGAGSYLFKVTAYNAGGESAEAVTPTSSGVDLRAYEAEDGVYVEFVAYDVEVDGSIMLALVDSVGNVLWSGSMDVAAGPQSLARFLVPGLELGQSYSFKVRDEVGQWWDVKDVTVGSFDAKMAGMTLDGLTITFDSLPERNYDIQWTRELGGTWQTVTGVTANAERTSVVVEYPESGEHVGFFRVQGQ